MHLLYILHFFNDIAYFFVLYFFFGELSVDVLYLFLFWSGSLRKIYKLR